MNIAISLLEAEYKEVERLQIQASKTINKNLSYLFEQPLFYRGKLEGIKTAIKILKNIQTKTNNNKL